MKTPSQTYGADVLRGAQARRSRMFADAGVSPTVRLPQDHLPVSGSGSSMRVTACRRDCSLLKNSTNAAERELPARLARRGFLLDKSASYNKIYEF